MIIFSQTYTEAARPLFDSLTQSLNSILQRLRGALGFNSSVDEGSEVIAVEVKLSSGENE